MFKLFAAGLLLVCLAGNCPQFSRASVIPTTSLPEQGNLLRELVKNRKALRDGAAEIQRGENGGSEGKKLAEYMINELKRRTPIAEGDEVVEPKNLGRTRNGERNWSAYLCYYYPSYCYAGCASHQFECANGLCIPGYWECDNWDDCGDLSDEVNCACADDEFSCTSGGCIPDYWQCDQEDDCHDASDEQGCAPPTCGGWGDWGEWSECNVPCGTGQRQRTRVCPCEPATLCQGEGTESQTCQLQTCLPEAGCGGTFTTPTGVIQTPTHLDSYRHSQTCSWIITVSDQRSVSLRFLSMDIEAHSSCNYDYIEIYDGVDSNSPMLTQRLCGTTPPTDAIISSGASMLVRFVSDSSVSGEGFVATYQEVIAPTCGGWDDWGEWSECNAPCGAGLRHRTRVCPCEPATLCQGENTEYQMCQLQTCLPEAESGCGTRHTAEPSINRIVGGQDAARGAWPWYAQLIFGNSFSCGGTLVDNTYIVTAAHCVYGSNRNVAANWRVILGKNREEDDSSNDEHSSYVTEIIIHENYNDSTTDNDIAVMVLASPPSEDSQFINSVCLDTVGSVSFDSTSVCFIAGFGTTEEDGNVADVLQEAMVPLVNSGNCNSAYGGLITDNMICAGYEEGGIDSCQGDSGGPLVCSRQDELADVERWYLTGITSWGYGCARPNFPGVYTNVARYGDWLENVFASHNGQ